LAVRFLLDTHVVVRWLSEPKRLSKEQTRVIQESVRRGEPLGLSAITLLEIAILLSGGSTKIKSSIGELFATFEDETSFRILPLTTTVAEEAGGLTGLHDPADRAIVATARVHGLRLLTSDQRIIEANLVSVID
jgi:PIN domain nuclease of toxin-antitoxin system